MQFDRLVQSREAPRRIVLETDVAQVILTRHGNVISCICDLHTPTPEGLEALRRRGAAEDTFMISPNLSGKEFGAWLDRLLVDDLGAKPDSEVTVMEQEFELEAASTAEFIPSQYR
ncbi:MAG TPA: hypothetical protein VK009_16280 [Chloroflexota bacterium]|nr:hypothetical protein [Chloroflexota bacterium]